MIRTLQEFFQTRIATAAGGGPRDLVAATPERALQLATAALLIEVSRADHDVQDDERAAIEESLAKSFGLTADETQEIVALAEKEVDEAISLYEFTRLVDLNFTPDQKKHVVGLLWEVAYSDARLRDNEEYLIRKVAKLLHVEHRDFIEEKLAARTRAERRGPPG